MKMKNSEIVTFLNTCTDLRQKRLPVRLAYAIKITWQQYRKLQLHTWKKEKNL